ncbi:hypothetical protein CLAFUW4_07567 [Fulvia fulva]|uniref:Uncharacterized protein n=1 Tax=Passalora fulva TaxID=5499 RepID=A0A9Q8UQS1_PASFU|nr:uncharacterized protein CLAFUR5_07697 [Fulvia fulva]KAK4623515.1 hypothetical protein CLAFUR0_07572 [Fulvia fulva]UJO18955.1 hypothetical protein CLAFUR5_07697 [Fulvia fulva]WPV16185.1 hypothetical protein CLAFUW4_07567 [Fulvia fulva]WPV31636.1 hypothetical protein CLAFUW7_07569 [Fulvia fulva]
MIEWATIRSHAMREYRQRQRSIQKRQHESTANACRTTVAEPERLRKGHKSSESAERRHVNVVWRSSVHIAKHTPTTLQHDAHLSTSLDDVSLSDPGASSEWTSDCLALFGRYLRWLKPEGDFTLPWEHDYSPSPLLLAASVLSATRHLQAAHFIRPCNTHLAWRHAILKRLLGLGDALDKDFANAATCLLHFELCHGSEEAIYHLRGLRSTTKLEKCMPAWELQSCTMSLEMGDLLHALLFEHPLEVLSHDQGATYDRKFSVYHLSVLASELQVDCGPCKTSELQALKDVYRSMSEAASRMELSLADNTTVPDSDITPDAPDDQQSALSLTGMPKDLTLFVQASSATIAILHNYAVRRLSIRHVDNEEYVKKVITAIMHMDDSSWQGTQYSRIFILMTGLCASTEQPARSFFEAHLIRAILQAGTDEWTSVQSEPQKTDARQISSFDPTSLAFTIKFLANRDDVRIASAR